MPEATHTGLRLAESAAAAVASAASSPTEARSARDPDRELREPLAELPAVLSGGWAAELTALADGENGAGVEMVARGEAGAGDGAPLIPMLSASLPTRAEPSRVENSVVLAVWVEGEKAAWGSRLTARASIPSSLACFGIESRLCLPAGS